MAVGDAYCATVSRSHGAVGVGDLDDDAGSAVSADEVDVLQDDQGGDRLEVGVQLCQAQPLPAGRSGDESRLNRC